MFAGTAGGAGVGRLLSEGSAFAGGLPGGVVDWSTFERQVRYSVAHFMMHIAFRRHTKRREGRRWW